MLTNNPALAQNLSFGSVVVSHFHDDFGNLFSEFPGDHLDRHFLILDAVLQQMGTGRRATRNKTANSYVVAIAI